jgi:hypothetical protein
LSELKDDLINNWEILYSNPNYRPCKKNSGGPVDRASNRQIYNNHFNQVPLLKNLVDTFETMLPYLSVNLVWLLHKSKEGDGFQGWHKDFYMGGQITKTIVVTVGSKERENEETPVSFDNTFKMDNWNEIDDYALSVLNNSEDKLHKDEQKPAAIPTKNPSVTAEDDTKPAATLQEEMYKDEQKPAAVPTKNPSVTAEDDTEPVATLQEVMFTTIQELPIIQQSILSIPAFGSNVVPWICEFCDSQWPPLQKRCGGCKRWKGGKRSLLAKKDSKEKTVSNNKGKKKGRKSKLLTPIPGQDVDIPLVVGGALVVGDTTFSPLTGGFNANKSSIGPSIGTNSYDDATIGENTVA